MRRTPLERFLDHIQRSPSGCWRWTGPDRGLTVDGALISPRKLAWLTILGRLPSHDLVTTCSREDCVRPGHLRRASCSLAMPRRAGRRLAGDEIDRLRQLRAAGQSLAALATLFKISISGVSRIVNNNRRQTAA
jgi:hypothetical protein